MYSDMARECDGIAITCISGKLRTGRACPDRGSVDHLPKALEVACLRLVGGPWRQVVAFQARRQSGRAAKEPAGLLHLEAGEPRRFKECGAMVGRLDEPHEFARQQRGQAEAPVDGGEQALL